MTYEKLIELALKGRSVNQAAKDWGIPQTTLDKYVKGKRIPDYQTALVIARESGADAGEVMQILARQEAQKKPRRFFSEIGYATAAFLVSVNLFLTPQNAEATPRLAAQSIGEMSTLYYVKWLKKLRAVSARLKRMFSRRALKAATP